MNIELNGGNGFQPIYQLKRGSSNCPLNVDFVFLDNIFQVRIPFLLVFGEHFLDKLEEVLTGGFNQTISLWIVRSRVSQIYVIVLEKINQFGRFEGLRNINNDLSW
jgi:hypothetical protein